MRITLSHTLYKTQSYRIFILFSQRHNIILCYIIGLFQISPPPTPKKVNFLQISPIIEPKKSKNMLSIILYIYPQEPKKVSFRSNCANNRGQKKPKKVLSTIVYIFFKTLGKRGLFIIGII